MARDFTKFGNGIKVGSRTSAPSSPELGDAYYDSTLGVTRIYQASGWVNVESAEAGLFNYVANPSAALDTANTAVTGSFAVTRGTTPATFSDSYFSIATGATASSSISWGMNTLQEKHDGQLMRFSARVKMPATTHTYTLELRTGASFAAGTVVPGTALVLTASANMKWESLFVLDTSLTYWVGIYRTSGTTNETILVDDVTFSPELTVAGSATSPWQDYIPTFSAGLGTVTLTYAKWRQNGQSIEIIGRFVNGTIAASVATMTMPTGLTGDTASNIVTGNWRQSGASTDNFKSGSFLVANSNIITFMDDNSSSASSGSPFAAANATVLFRTGATVGFNISFPVAEWAGSSLTMANSQVEYWANSGATTTANSNNSSATAFQSPLGTPFTAIASNVTAAQYTTFDIPIANYKATDKWEVEMTNSTSNNQVWFRAPEGLQAGTARYGVFAEPNSSSSLRVYFGNAGARPTGATYGAIAAAGNTWADYSGYRWRVVKSANPLGIGTGLATATQPGAVSNYAEGTWTPTRTGGANLSTSPTFGTATYVRIGNHVTAYIDSIANFTITTAGSPYTYITVASTGLPGVVNASVFYGSGVCYVDASPYESLPLTIQSASISNTDIFIKLDALNTGIVNGDALKIQSLFFTYKI